MSSVTSTSSELSRTEQFALVERLTNWYESCFLGPDATEARDYLSDRKFSDESVKGFRLGWAPVEFTFEANEVELQQLETWDYIARESDGSIHHNYENRIMFPVHDPQGRVRGFSGRRIGDTNAIKYYNSAESDMFSKSELLFGFEKARRSIFLNNKAIICEGYTDAIAFHQVGKPIAVACMGIALTEAHLLQLMRYTDTCLFAFDPDNAGSKALKKSVELCQRLGMNYGRFNLPEGADPAAYLLGGEN